MRKTRIGIALTAVAVAVTALAGVANAAPRSTVSIEGGNIDFWGHVQSSDPYCEQERKVKLFMQLGSYQDPKNDLRIGTDFTDLAGLWALGNQGYRYGAFYAKAARVRGYCRAATSQTIVR
jgi:hypothetical protein